MRKVRVAMVNVLDNNARRSDRGDSSLLRCEKMLTDVLDGQKRICEERFATDATTEYIYIYIYMVRHVYIYTRSRLPRACF